MNQHIILASDKLISFVGAASLFPADKLRAL